MPLQLCCPTSNGGDTVLRLKRFLMHYFQTEDTIHENEDNVGLHDDYPNYVHYILRHIGKPIPEWWEQEFRRWIEGFNDVMVFDCRALEEEENVF